MEPESSAMDEIHCQHHWVIEPSAGPTSNGVCQRCGAEKEFQNTIEVTTWTVGSRKDRPVSNTES